MHALRFGMASDSGQIADALIGPALHDAKRVLRDQVLAARDAVDAKDRAVESRAIAARVCTLPSLITKRFMTTL